MYRLQKEFGDNIDFIGLDVDDLETRSTRMGLGMRNRSHYMLRSADGGKIAQWFGPLNEQALFEELGEKLTELN